MNVPDVVHDIKFVTSKRGCSQLVVDSKIFQKKSEKRNVDDIVISRSWSCRDLTCGVGARTVDYN